MQILFLVCFGLTVFSLKYFVIYKMMEKKEQNIAGSKRNQNFITNNQEYYIL